MTTAVVPAAKKLSEIRTFGDLMQWAAPQIASVLPKHLSAERMVKLVFLASHKTPKLRECTPISLFHAMMNAARLGLEIGSRAHLVPFKNECVLIPDYRGLVDLARNGDVKHVEARVVYKDDEFDWALGDKPFIKHKPKLRTDAGRQTDESIIAFYGVAYLNGMAAIEVMSKAEVDAIRARSRAKDDGPWVTDYPMMGRKTVIKRLCKSLPQTPELQAAIELDNRGESGEIGAVNDLIDSPESVNQSVAEQTKQKAEDLKARLTESTGGEPVPPPPPEREPVEVRSEAKSSGPAKAKGGQKDMMF